MRIARELDVWYARIGLAPVVIAAFIAVGGCSEADRSAESETRAHGPSTGHPARHVIFISFDTTRRDHFGCYGNPWIRTPRMDAFAADAILLDQYMTVVTTTLASHASLLTGKYPHHHGTPRNGYVVHPDNVTLAEILKAAGFRTAAFIASFALESRFDLDQGFDLYDETFDLAVSTQSIQAHPRLRPFIEQDEASGKIAGALERGAPRTNDQVQRDAESVTNAVLDYLDREPAPERLFLFVHYFDPHMLYQAPEPFDMMYGIGAGAFRVTLDEYPGGFPTGFPALLRENVFEYAGEVSYMDAQAGRLLDDLKQRGILDDALVVITSDHGENLTDGRTTPFDHGATVYNFETAGVGMVRLPGGRHAGRRYGGLTASIDILPTVLSYLGLDAPDGIDGEPIDLQTLQAPRKPRARFAEATKPWGREPKEPERWRNALKPHCVRMGPYKYMRDPAAQRDELYNVEVDPHERRNLLPPKNAQLQKVALALRQRLVEWSQRPVGLVSAFEGMAQRETIERLRAIGYLTDPNDEAAVQEALTPGSQPATAPVDG